MRTLLLSLATASLGLAASAQESTRVDELTALEYDFMDIRVHSDLGGVDVTWLALDTVGLEGYEVQRANEFGDWSTIYRLPARRSLILLEETWTDPQPQTGFNAYRVARVFRDEPDGVEREPRDVHAAHIRVDADVHEVVLERREFVDARGVGGECVTAQRDRREEG